MIAPSGAPRGLCHHSDDVFSDSCMRVEPGLNLSGSQEPAKCSHVHFATKPLKRIPWVVLSVQWPPNSLMCWTYVFLWHWSHYPMANACQMSDPNVWSFTGNAYCTYLPQACILVSCKQRWLLAWAIDHLSWTRHLLMKWKFSDFSLYINPDVYFNWNQHHCLAVSKNAGGSAANLIESL